MKKLLLVFLLITIICAKGGKGPKGRGPPKAVTDCFKDNCSDAFMTCHQDSDCLKVFSSCHEKGKGV